MRSLSPLATKHGLVDRRDALEQGVAWLSPGADASYCANRVCQPVAASRSTVRAPKIRLRVEQRLRAVEQGGHQRSELDDLRAGLGRAVADPEREPSRDPCRLRQQAGLAHARLSLDEHHRAGARAHAVKVDTD